MRLYNKDVTTAADKYVRRDSGTAIHKGEAKPSPGTAVGEGKVPMISGPQKSNRPKPKPTCVGKEGACRAYPIMGSDLCYFHGGKASG